MRPVGPDKVVPIAKKAELLQRQWFLAVEAVKVVKPIERGQAESSHRDSRPRAHVPVSALWA